jgi:hypothetical protein
MLETHEFVQKIEKSKGPTGQIPAIILYSENQMKDFEMFVKNTDKPRVGIDRTFNLGCFFVTSIVYIKNTRVVRRETNDHPIFLGPILLHKDAGCDKYHYFLSHISARLSSTINNVDVILPPGIHMGSDDEKAFTNAIDSVFPASNRSLCNKHLKDNVSDYLKNKIGVNTKDRVNIVERIFGDNGILKSKDEYQFEERCNIITTMDGSNAQFCKYFANTLKPKLTLNFKNLGNSANTWTNNNAESMHNIMEMYVGGRICLIYIICVCLRIVVSNT